MPNESRHSWMKTTSPAPRELPEGIDPNVPSIARAYDYSLGGKDNFPVDRALVDQMTDAERAEYLVESLFLNTVTYENERLGALIRKLPNE